MAGKIIGVSKDEKFDYEFMVVFAREDGDFDWHSSYETVRAFDVAKEVGGVVVHNIRVSGKKKRKI